jgi:two-component system OmpR family sensor kinase/two-component system sensor histidine kinase BaeS
MADSLQQAETLRRHLMADIAHELRTPLTVMQGNLRALLDDVYPLEKREIATLYDESRLLNRLVDDLRELALAEAGALSLQTRAVDMARLLEQTRAQFAAAADAQGIALTLDIPAPLPSAHADADRVAQVLRNLIANALRHTPGEGVISIQVSVTSESVITGSLITNNSLLITVSDSGEGIDPEALPHVFERFYRADPSRARASGGSGLGLAIAKAWVEAMGGQMGARSEPGRGSAFWFSLPMA